MDGGNRFEAESTMTPRRDPGARARAVPTATGWYANPAPPGRGRTSSGELMGRRGSGYGTTAVAMTTQRHRRLAGPLRRPRRAVTWSSVHRLRRRGPRA
jgi:hypothetical protein